MKRKTSKLNVRRETLRQLANVEISRAVGGFDTDAGNCVVARAQVVTSTAATCVTG